jgi:hypothetical protein
MKQQKMINSSQELEAVQKLDGLKSPEPTTLAELFSEHKKVSPEMSEEIKKYVEAYCQKELSISAEQSSKEHEMSMKERQASVNTSNVITGVIASWGIMGIVMLARSCINFDKGPKFKV